MSPNPRSRPPPRAPAAGARRRRTPRRCPDRLRRRQRSDSGSTSIVVTHGYTDAEATALKAAAATWNQQHPDQKVTLQFNGGNDSALQKTVAGFTAGNYPDVAYQYGSSAAQLVRQPKLVDLTDRVTAPSVDWNDFYPSAREAATVDGKVVGVPALIDNLSLVYNKAMFAQAGVAPPTNDWTWQDFRDAAAKLTDASTKTLRLGLRQRRQRGHGVALPGAAVAGGRRPAERRQHRAGLRLPRRQGRSATARGHGRDRQVGLPRPGQRQLPEPLQQREDRDARGPVRGTCRASTPT